MTDFCELKQCEFRKSNVKGNLHLIYSKKISKFVGYFLS